MRPANERAARGSGRRGVSVFGLRRVDCTPTPRGCFVVDGVVHALSERGLWFVNASASLVSACSAETCVVLVEHAGREYRVEVEEPRDAVELRRCLAYREAVRA
jgi:hypothetical protein